MRLEKHKPTDMALSYFFIVIFIIILIIMACWAIDISVSSLLTTKYVADSTLTNGFWFTDPAKLYHIGLYIIVLFTACLSFLCVRLIINNYRYKLLLEQHGIPTKQTK
jgi:hypothetical protein